MNTEYYESWRLAMQASSCLLQYIGRNEAHRSIAICANLLNSDSIEFREKCNTLITAPEKLNIELIHNTQDYIGRLESLCLNICDQDLLPMKKEYAVMLYACILELEQRTADFLTCADDFDVLLTSQNSFLDYGTV